MNQDGSFKQARRSRVSHGGINFQGLLGDILEQTPKLGIIVDFDGTLSHLARTPEQAFINPEHKKCIEKLARLSDVNVVVISGRHLQDLRTKVRHFFEVT